MKLFSCKYFLALSLMYGLLLANEPIHQLQASYTVAKYNRNNISNESLQIRVIDSEELAKANANNLRDLLANQVGFQIVDDPATLTSSIKLNGISGENIRILIDGIPVIGLVSGSVDISQIPIHDVESIEIIETPLAVEYGSNALGGVIHIKTKEHKKRSKYNAKATASWESTGQNSLFGSTGFSGENHRFGAKLGLIDQQEIKELERKPLWNGYSQYSMGVWYGFAKTNWAIESKIDGLYDVKELHNNWIADANSLEFDDVLGEFVAKDSIAADVDYRTFRTNLQNQLQVFIGDNEELQITQALAFYQRKTVHNDVRFSTNVAQEIKERGSENSYQSQNYSSVYTNKNNEKYPYLLGGDLNVDHASGPRILNEKQQFLQSGLFYSQRVQWAAKLNFDVGLRYQYHSKFAVNTLGIFPLIPSLSVSWDITDQVKYTAGYGRGFRSPSMQELYFNFHDGGSHNIDGNQNLIPERSHNYHSSIQVNHKLDSQWVFSNKVNAFYHDLSDRITLAERTDLLKYYRYENLNRFYSLGLNVENNWEKSKYMQLKTMIGIQGESILKDENAVGYAYLVVPDAAWEFSYSTKYGSTHTFRHKYNGEQPYYTIEEDSLMQGLVEDWHQFDILGSQCFKGKLEPILINYGVKNLLGTIRLNNSGTTQSGGHTSSESLASRGRQFFINLQYQYNHRTKK